MAVTWKTYNDRGKVVTQAQRLAHSGQHADHATILPLLQHMEGFEAARARLEEPAMRVQLDRLCAAARNPSISGVDFAAEESRGKSCAPRPARAAMVDRLVEAPPHASTRA